MKYKSLIFSIILVSVTLLASWTVPALVQKMTDDSHSYPLMYYSAQLKELCVIDIPSIRIHFMIFMATSTLAHNTIHCFRC